MLVIVSSLNFIFWLLQVSFRLVFCFFFFMFPLHSGFNKTFLAMHFMVLLCESMFHTVPSAVFFQGYLQEEKATEQHICGERVERAYGLVGIEA